MGEYARRAKDLLVPERWPGRKSLVARPLERTRSASEQPCEERHTPPPGTSGGVGPPLSRRRRIKGAPCSQPRGSIRARVESEFATSIREVLGALAGVDSIEGEAV